MSRDSSEELAQSGPEPNSSGVSSLRKTGSSVRFWDKVAGVTITGGGLAVLAAMLGICIFLIASAAPLFRAGGASATSDAAFGREQSAPLIVRLGVREGTALIIDADGVLRETSTESGRVVATADLRSDRAPPSAATYDPQGHTLSLAYPDGSVRSSSIEQPDILLDSAHASKIWGELELHGSAPLNETQRESIASSLRLRDGLSEQSRVVRLGDQTWVVQDLVVDLDDGAVIPGIVGRPKTIHRARASERLARLVCLTDEGRLFYAESRRVVSLGGGSSKERVKAREIELGEASANPIGAFVTSDGESVFLVFEDGVLRRFDASNGVKTDIPEVESTKLFDDGARVTAVEMALGGLSLLVGDSSGRVISWTLVSDETGGGLDGQSLRRAATADTGDAPVTSIGVGERDRTVALGLGDGGVELRNMTSGKRVARLPKSDASVIGVGIAPALDRVVALSDDGAIRSAPIEPGHPQSGWTSLFGRVLYEGYDKPEFIYQSTGAQGVEAKLSLTPLIWGTLKATVIAMLIAAPIAVLGAVFSSEFMHPRLRRTIKPTVELMASLPSVVLGFVAAVLVAPYVRDWLPAILVAFGVVPLTVMGAAHAWRLAPVDWARRLTSARLMLAVGAVLIVSLGISAIAGPQIERVFFAPNAVDRALASGHYEAVEDAPAWLRGRRELDVSQERRLRADGLALRDGQIVRAQRDRVEAGSSAGGDASIRRWLDGAIGNAWPGWVMVMVLPMSVLVAFVNARFFARRWAGLVVGRSRRAGAGLELLRFLVSAAATLVLALGSASVLTGAGLDPRDSIFGPFTQRNTLVVGLVMGFAVIPIIYTIADDAMQAVPNSLRSASLGAGATRWQTAIRIVLPVAGSGIFSACMIGLGRAVGETMIVLMATGNTPEMTLNIFSGFRTLAANIAVELPEAARGGTHYRVLFLCGLVLFAMTAIINTSAELVRQSFRKRNAAL